MADYIPPARDWVREQVERYEGSGGKEGTTLRDTGLPVILVTYTGRKTGAIRKTPLMRVVTDDGKYVLVASKGGAPEHPAWYYSLREQPDVTIRDHERVFRARIHEVTDPRARPRLGCRRTRLPAVRGVPAAHAPPDPRVRGGARHRPGPGCRCPGPTVAQASQRLKEKRAIRDAPAAAPAPSRAGG